MHLRSACMVAVGGVVVLVVVVVCCVWKRPATVLRVPSCSIEPAHGGRVER